MIASAPLAARAGHTSLSVIDAAGAIYVIGGQGLGPYYNDVWKSTDKGAHRTCARTRTSFLKRHRGMLVSLTDAQGGFEGIALRL